jgi:hypothetical protein
MVAGKVEKLAQRTVDGERGRWGQAKVLSIVKPWVSRL